MSQGREEKEEYEEKRMAEEPKKDRQQELKIIKFHGKADLNIQQWLRLLELKCKQIGLDTKSLVEQLIDIFGGRCLGILLRLFNSREELEKDKRKTPTTIQYPTGRCPHPLFKFKTL